MMSPFRTPAPPDDSAEIEEIEKWLMELPARPGYRPPPPRTPAKGLFARSIGCLCIAIVAAYLVSMIVAIREVPALIPALVVMVVAMASHSPWARRRIVRRNMQRAGLLPKR